MSEEEKEKVTTALDVSPTENIDIMEPVSKCTAGGSAEVVPEPKKKSVFDQIADKVKVAVRGDRSIARANDAVSKAKQALAEAEAESTRVTVEAERNALKQAKRLDKSTIAKNANAKKLQNARLTEAKLLMANNLQGLEYIRRHGIKDDNPDLHYYLSQLDNTKLTGTIYSAPPSRQKKG